MRPGLSVRARGGPLTTLAVVLTVLLPAVPAAADDPRSEQQKVREEKAKAAGRLNVLKADNAEVEQALDALESNVQGASGQLSTARQEAAAAAAAAEMATADASAALGRLQGAREALVADVVRAYTDPTAGGADATGIATDDISEAARKIEYERLRSGSQADALDGARAARLALEEARARAQKAFEAASKRRADVAAQLVRLQSAQQLQQRLTSAFEQKIDAAQSELGSLNEQDKQLAEQIARQAEQAERAEQAARQRGGQGGGGGGGDGGGGNGGGGGGGDFSVRSSGAGGLATVGGITVSASIAGQVGALLSAASAAGIRLGGSGYRSPAGQIAVRRSNCGSSDYAIYRAPSSSCRPPTAPPGRSMHERGLAIDFTHNGSIISSRSSPAYRWLAGNAGRFGLRNLPSEPWHWSTNGQ